MIIWAPFIAVFFTVCVSRALPNYPPKIKIRSK